MGGWLLVPRSLRTRGITAAMWRIVAPQSDCMAGQQARQFNVCNASSSWIQTGNLTVLAWLMMLFIDLNISAYCG